MSAISDFESLADLKKFLTSIRDSHATTLNQYVSEDRRGFFHQLPKRLKASRSSSSTCISSLVNAGLWESSSLYDRTAEVAAQLIKKKWVSAELPENNPFTVSFIIEGVLDLMSVCPNYKNESAHSDIINSEMARLLIDEFKSEQTTNDGKRKKIRGAIAIEPYTESAFLTHLAFRVLQRLALESDVTADVHAWSRQEINRQIALISADSRVADPLQLAYALILAATAQPDAKTSPQDKHTFEHGLFLFFDSQNGDGSWPQSQPLFHYPDVGNAYCFEYELLTQLLMCRPLRDDLLPYLPNLERAALALTKSRFDLDAKKPGTVVGWASGHHPHIEGPESWSTASVYHFAYQLDRLVAEAIRRALFNELGAIYRAPVLADVPLSKTCPKFATGFLDANLKFKGTRSLRNAIAKSFVFPIAQELEDVAKGRSFSPETPMSAILFGPPGTSKTQLAEHIAKYLGWPLLSVDPSYLVQEGMDRIQAMANRLFSMLTVSEQIVVLLDEFDEMGRDRARSNEMLARFITTAMLPKLAKINKERKIVFLLATNYVSGFDAAFSRGGRFDMLVQVMPPNRNAKFKNWPIFDAGLKAIPQQKRADLATKIDDLTYLETKELADVLSELVDPPNLVDPLKIEQEVEEAWKNCTLNKPNEINQPNDFHADDASEQESSHNTNHLKWRDTCKIEEKQIRLPRR